MDITAKYTHTKFGTFMFNLCAKGTKFVVKHRGLYYLLAFTGGIIMTAIGLLVSFILLLAKLFGCKNINFKKYNGVYSISIGPDYGGGFSTGIMFLRDQKSASRYIDPHEFGHMLSQNCILGPFFPFLVAIPSAIRGWARELKPNKDWPEYDSAWFEDAASQCGAYAVWYLNNTKDKQ